jgi:hypothetical protein
MHRRAAIGIVLRHSGQSFVVAASFRVLSAVTRFTGKTTTK